MAQSQTMVALTGARFCRNTRLPRSRPVVIVLLVAWISSLGAAQQRFPGLRDVDRFNDALQAVLPVNIVRQFANPRTDGSTGASATKCSKQVKLLEEGLRNGTLWALTMMDASSKIPSGILTGNQKDLGMYDECVAVNVAEGDEHFRGRHCMYKVVVGKGALQLSETLSVCMPSTCGPEEIRGVLNGTFEMASGLVGMDISVFGVTCSSLDPPEWTAGGIVTLVGLSALLLFLVVCTICDIFLQYRDEKYESSDRLAVMRQFSFYGNARRILSTRTSAQTLPALQGLRFFSMCLVIFGHEYFMHLFAPTVNFTDLMKWASSWESLLMMSATFTVDSFFTISGFLMSYLFLKEMSTGRTFNIFAYYIHRYLRLTPAFASLLLITIFILPRMGSGPLWESLTTAEDEICRKSWWSMLLYVHNYVNRGCLAHTWYLSVEMQYFWFSPIILYPLARKPKIGLFILTVCLVAAIVIPAKISYDNQYTNAMFANGDIEKTMNTLANFYMESHVRAAPWLIGIFFGYLVFTQKGPSRRATKWVGWILAVAAFGFCIFSRRKFQEEGYGLKEYNAVWETFWVAVARPSWGAAVAWVIYACVRGFGGPITKILSFSIFNPLSRLSYCMYLVHYVIQSTKVRATRVPRFFTSFAAFDYFLSDLMLSLFIAFFFSLVFESPILVLERLVKKRVKRKTDESKKNLSNEKVENGIDNPTLTLDQ